MVWYHRRSAEPRNHAVFDTICVVFLFIKTSPEVLINQGLRAFAVSVRGKIRIGQTHFSALRTIFLVFWFTSCPYTGNNNNAYALTGKHKHALSQTITRIAVRRLFCRKYPLIKCFAQSTTLQPLLALLATFDYHLSKTEFAVPAVHRYLSRGYSMSLYRSLRCQ